METKTRISCQYELDAACRVTAFDQGWSDFAIENDAPELASAESTIGRSLFSFFGDPTTTHLYRELFARVRSSQRPVTVRIRCDAPKLVRELDLTISPLEAGGFHVRSELVNSHARPRMSVLDRAVRRSGETLLMCSWCKSVYANGQWVELEEGAKQLRLLERASMPRLSHGVCGSCYRWAARELGYEP